jgi:hypothetical protein
MAIIIETCPKCGFDLHDTIIATNPPIPQKKCFECGWEWTGEPEEVIRRPFGGNSLYPDYKYTLMGSKYDEIINADDSCCSLNNINGHAFVTTSNLSNGTINHEKIIESIERAMRYRQIKQGF